MNNLLRSILFLIIFSAFFGCIKEKFDPDKLSKYYMDDLTAAVPIGYSTVTLPELFAPQIDSGILVQDADGLLRFRFTQGLYTLNVSDIIVFPEFDTAYTIINITGQAIDLNPAGTNIQLSQTFYLDFGYSQGQNGEEIDSILLNNMAMEINVIASGLLNAAMNSTFPGILYNNLAYSKNLVVSSSNNYADLMSYTVHLQNTGPNKNQLQVNFTLNMHQTARIIAPGETIMDIHLHFSAIDFAALYGYIGQITIDPAPIINNRIELLNDNVSGYFNFEFGQFDLITQNSFGVPFLFKLDNFDFQTYETATNTMVYQNAIVPSQSSNIAFPNMLQIGQTVEGESPINSGSVQLAFQDYYSLVSGDLSGLANPNGNQDYNFVLENSQLEITTGYSVPFWGYSDNFHTIDTINFPLAAFFNSTYTDINRMVFVTNFTNALPMDAESQIYFCNISGIVLDSMFVAPYHVSGSSQADGNGKVTAQTSTPAKAEFVAARLANISETAYLLVKSNIKTVGVENSPPISWKFFNDYYFNVEIGVAATVNQ